MKTKNLLFTVAIATVGFACSSSQKTTEVASHADSTGARTIASKECDEDAFISRVDAKCSLSNNDKKRIRDSAKYCKNLISKGNNLEIVILDKTGDIAIIDTKAPGKHGQKCASGRFEFGSGFEQMKLADGYAFLVTEVGNLYVYSSFTRKLYMILSSGGHPYAETTPVVSIEGTTVTKNGESHPGVIAHLKNGGSPTWSSDRLNSPSNDQLRQVSATEVTGLSIFNDK